MREVVVTQSKNSPEGKDHFWSFPFSYGANVFVFISLWTVGFILEYVTWGRGVVVPRFPFNLYILVSFIALWSLLFLHSRFEKIFIWLSSIPFAIVSVCSFAFVLLAAAIFPQPLHEEIGPFKDFGLSHITRSWPYAFNLLLILTSLFLVTLKRCLKLEKNDWGFIANHLGLFIALVGGSFGSGDFVRVKMDLILDRVVFEAYDLDNHRGSMPFALKLLNFKMEEYDPKIVVVDPLKGVPHPKFIKKSWPFKEGEKILIEGHEVLIKKYYPIAIALNGVINPHYGPGSAPVALLQIGEEEGVVTFGSTMMKSSFVHLEAGMSLGLAIPNPKFFSSEIEYYNAETNEKGIIKTEVNSPVTLFGWRLYQYGYDEKLGRWSDKSTIEAIYDPWLFVTYTGIFLMMAGAVHLLIFARREE